MLRTPSRPHLCHCPAFERQTALAGCKGHYPKISPSSWHPSLSHSWSLLCARCLKYTVHCPFQHLWPVFDLLDSTDLWPGSISFLPKSLPGFTLFISTKFYSGWFNLSSVMSVLLNSFKGNIQAPHQEYKLVEGISCLSKSASLMDRLKDGGWSFLFYMVPSDSIHPSA